MDERCRFKLCFDLLITNSVTIVTAHPQQQELGIYNVSQRCHGQSEHTCDRADARTLPAHAATHSLSPYSSCTLPPVTGGWGDHLSVARRSMKLEGVRGSRERRSGARLNRWPTVTGAWLNMRPFYLQTEGQHSHQSHSHGLY